MKTRKSKPHVRHCIFSNDTIRIRVRMEERHKLCTLIIQFMDQETVFEELTLCLCQADELSEVLAQAVECGRKFMEA